MSDRASKSEVEYRVILFADAIASGLATRSHLLQIASEEEWDISERQVDTYIAKARDLFKEREVENIDVKRRKRIKQLEHLAQKNYLRGDYQEVRHCIKQISDIEGIVKSRFRDEEEGKESTGLAVVSRFDDKWKKASGSK